MRLKQIKIAGFKSFVDPTAFELPGNLIGIVGPNGCGKSNIMDAVRWVLGESRAGELRGDSMQDVIFSGSDTRRAAARASVELLFDNQDGRLGGAWSRYGEIALRRVLSRDGQSVYQINQQVVRRRDVQDLFLGTGLGPRAYAVIGQGTIGRILEAKPEELRGFLEEAAGVSRYRERRRQTEERLAETRLNLARIDDLLGELRTQMQRLEQQCATAERARKLESERSTKLGLLRLVQRDEASERQRLASEQLSLAEQAFAEQLLALRADEDRVEGLREAHLKGGDALHSAQAAYYDASATRAANEAELRRLEDERARILERLAASQTLRDQAIARLGQAQRDRDEQSQRIDRVRVAIDALGTRLEHARQAQEGVERDAWAQQRNLESARLALANTQRRLEVAQERARSGRDRMSAAEQRVGRRRQELQTLVLPDEQSLERAQAQAHAAEQRERDAQAQSAALEEQRRALEQTREQAHSGLRNAKTQKAQLEARRAALVALQDRVAASGRLRPWLTRHGLDQLAPIWQSIAVVAGWELALEAVLRERIGALEVRAVEPGHALESLLGDPPPARFAVLTGAARAAESGTDGEVIGPADGIVTQAPSSWITASDCVAPFPLREAARCERAALAAVLGSWLDGFWAVQGFEEALRWRATLPLGHELVTAGGHRVGRDHVYFHHPDSEQDGLLARQQEIVALAALLQTADGALAESQAEVDRVERAAAQTQEALGRARETARTTTREAALARQQAEGLVQTRARALETDARLRGELAEGQAEIAEQTQFVAAAEGEAMAARQALALETQTLERVQQEVRLAQEALQAARSRLREAEREEQELAFELRDGQARAAQAQEHITRSQVELQRAQEEIASQGARLESSNDAELRARLEAAQTAQDAANATLASARQTLESIGQSLREADAQRLSRERAIEPIREQIQQAQLAQQAARLALEQVLAQISEESVSSGVDWDESALRALAQPWPKVTALQAEVARLVRAIAALGPVNMAALDELAQARERTSYLEAQSADLSAAMLTLEDAIRSIDRETRELLQETFTRVNGAFGQLFPQLFGGGQASLNLLGEEILDAGVQITAQPPGKRNTSIQLLSGGEKALTATALVFALFQLNPAPFCLLDEVDAALDDANTERYCRMVRTMSEHTQFLFITHNRIAMEFAQQLIGVTMQERGVSRIVAVDLAAAERLAEAA